MDKCLQHSKETTGPCMWCGKKLCDKCVAHTEGQKYYCEKCFSQLQPLQRRKQQQQPLVTNKGDAPWISKPSEK